MCAQPADIGIVRSVPTSVPKRDPRTSHWLAGGLWA